MAKSMKKSMKKSAMKKPMKKSMKKMKKMKKAMKSMKAMKAMKKKKAKRVSKIAKGKQARSQVLKGKKAKTSGGLKASDLRRNADGKVVSKKRSDWAKKNFRKSGLIKWFAAVKQARKQMGVKGFRPVGGQTQSGQALLKKVRSLYKK